MHVEMRGINVEKCGKPQTYTFSVLITFKIFSTQFRHFKLKNLKNREICVKSLDFPTSEKYNSAFFATLWRCRKNVFKRFGGYSIFNMYISKLISFIVFN